MIVHKEQIVLERFPDLPVELRTQIVEILGHVGLEADSLCNGRGTLTVPQFVQNGAGKMNLAPALGRVIGYVEPWRLERKKAQTQVRRQYPVKIDFEEIGRRAHRFAALIEGNLEGVVSILLDQESYEVAVDETERTLDLFRSLRENAAYFQRQIGVVATFLPRNQPLYALSCFGIIPALMASKVYVKPPTTMTGLFRRLADTLSLSTHFPNIEFSRQERQEFVRQHSKKCSDSSVPVTDAVIFTGTMLNADRIRAEFDSKTLFIANGAGHNPIVVAEDADISRAVSSVLRVQLYNSGQDCASPNAVMVHAHRYPEFIDALREGVRAVNVGCYQNRENRVGPLSDRKGLPEILETFIANAEYLDPLTPGVVRAGTGIVEPTIILKPLSTGGNFTEYFAPIFFIQRYERDADLGLYFDDPRYAPNAMFVTVDGHSPFVESLLRRTLPGGRPLHDPTTIVRNTNLHAPGVERGTQAYGGYGRGASCLSIDGVITPRPTLPQRDLFECLVRPAIEE